MKKNWFPKFAASNYQLVPLHVGDGFTVVTTISFGAEFDIELLDDPNFNIVGAVYKLLNPVYP